MPKKRTSLPVKAKTLAQANENKKIAGAVAGAQHARDDLERGQTPMGADKAGKLLDTGKGK